MATMTEWLKITSELVAPKKRKNTFGGYNYRSCEDILEAVKPLLKKYECNLLLSDEVVCIGNANYIKASAILVNKEGATATATGFAREETSKKGMDAPQMTGTASSYARKYALNGLFCIDDTKDADTNEYRTENNARVKQQTTAPTQPQEPAQATAPQQPQPEKKRNPLTFEQAKENELGFMIWLYNKYLMDKSLNAEKVIAEFYECDYATTCWLRDQFAKYVKQMEKK